jgi:hypothetical protein
MECAGCNSENREGAKFCKNCGAKLDLVCPSCGHSCDTDSSFCDQCGHDLTGPEETPPKELPFDKKLAKIQKYLPTGLAEKILSERDKIEGERRQVAGQSVPKGKDGLFPSQFHLRGVLEKHLRFLSIRVAEDGIQSS